MPYSKREKRKSNRQVIRAAKEAGLDINVVDLNKEFSDTKLTKEEREEFYSGLAHRGFEKNRKNPPY